MTVPEELFDILDEDSLIIAPILHKCKIPVKNNEYSVIENFDNSYSNEKPKALSEYYKILSCIMICKKSYDTIKNCHYSPFFSEQIDKQSFIKKYHLKHPLMENVIFCGKNESLFKETIVSCENIAFMLSLMGREIFIPIGMNFDKNKELLADDMPHINKFNFNREVLPGYTCIPYSPKYPISQLVAVQPTWVELKSGKKLKRPLIDYQVTDKENVLENFPHKNDDVKQSYFIKKKHNNTCLNCGKTTNGRCEQCRLIYGRRGWRSLGEYDG